MKETWTKYPVEDKRYVITEFPQPKKRQGEVDWIFNAQEILRYLGVEEKRIEGEIKIVTPFLRTSQIAIKTNRKPETIRKWIRCGWVRAIRFGFNVLRVEQKELDRFISENKTYLDMWKKVQVTPMSELREQVSKKRRISVLKGKRLPHIRRV